MYTRAHSDVVNPSLGFMSLSIFILLISRVVFDACGAYSNVLLISILPLLPLGADGTPFPQLLGRSLDYGEGAVTRLVRIEHFPRFSQCPTARERPTLSAGAVVRLSIGDTIVLGSS